MAKKGAPPIFKSVKDFEARNPEGFWAWLEENNHIPLWEWFAIYMGISRDTLLRYMAKDGMLEDGSYDKQQDFREPIKRIGTRIIAELIELNLLNNFKHDPLMIFYMKNYDYTDRQEVKADMTVTLQIDGNGLFD